MKAGSIKAGSGRLWKMLGDLRGPEKVLANASSALAGVL